MACGCKRKCYNHLKLYLKKKQKQKGKFVCSHLALKVLLHDILRLRLFATVLNHHTTATNHFTKLSLPVDLTEAHPRAVFWSVLSRLCFKNTPTKKGGDEAKTWQNLSDFGIWVVGRQVLAVPLHVFKTLYYVWKYFQLVYIRKLTFFAIRRNI